MEESAFDGTVSLGRRRVWFHASSVGELECLWPIVEFFGAHQWELILTILSPSAKTALSLLKRHLEQAKVVVIYCGFSPWEGEWNRALSAGRPDLFITARYEAWPDLWISLRQKKIPLCLVASRARKSLKIAKWFCDYLGTGLPELILFPCAESDIGDLAKLFPEAKIQVAGDPRWDRVHSRRQRGNFRAQAVIQSFQGFNKPWGIIGSAWLEDLKFLKEGLLKFQGTLWIVPHRTDSKSIQEIDDYMQTLGFSCLRSASDPSDHPAPRPGQGRICLLVNEVGFLLELYSVADWVFVGGGWGAGIHSTIEPAFCGVPIGVGPAGIEKFYEIRELSLAGQLHVLRNQSDLQRWTQLILDPDHRAKDQWMKDSISRLGATQKIGSALEKMGLL